MAAARLNCERKKEKVDRYFAWYAKKMALQTGRNFEGYDVVCVLDCFMIILWWDELDLEVISTCYTNSVTLTGYVVLLLL
uniref:Uncharacterized protein n=1 Tax=Solanum lycopersicum TaxID=4081 RepID=A0A3Q7GF22_SOLLC